MAEVRKYRVWCVTEAAYQYVWRDEAQGVPTECPNDPAHTIDTDKITTVETAGVAAPVSADGTPLVSSPDWTLGREAFKRNDDASEQMNIDGRALGDAVVLWNGTGAGDTGGDWTAGGDGSETAGSMKSGTNGWDTGVAGDNDKVRFNNGSMTDVDGAYAEIRFWINPQAFPLGSRPKIAWLDDSNDLVGSRLRIDDYVDNMDLDEWQHVHIPISDFGLTGDVQKLELKCTNGAGQHYHYDDIELIELGAGGPYRFELAAPDDQTIYHVSMLVLEVVGPTAGWKHDAFASIDGGLDAGLILRHKRLSDGGEVLWKFVSRDNAALYGQYHPQDDVTFADSKLLVGFMIKPGRASIKVTDDNVLQFVVRDDLSSLDIVRAYAHFGIEVVS